MSSMTPPSGTPLPASLSDIPVRKVHLRSSDNDPDSPWCYIVSSSRAVGANKNFLATQVWPSSRVAARALVEHAAVNESIHVVCELGCGPGLPSLALAAAYASTLRVKEEGSGMPTHVIATDIDPLALQLVEASAKEQNLRWHYPVLSTQIFDLTSEEKLPDADLYVLSDVFETNYIALGAAKHTVRALLNGKHVWVFAQSDRAQRDIYREEVLRLISEQLEYQNDDKTDFALGLISTQRHELHWMQAFPKSITERLWLCDVDELSVSY